jgi:hypothetical protein
MGMGRLLSLPEHQERQENILESKPGKDIPAVLETPVIRPTPCYTSKVDIYIHMNATAMQSE